MNFKEQLPQNFHSSSRVWIYQSDRAFTTSEIGAIQNELNNFVETWAAHSARVKGFASIFFNQFIVLIADETQTAVSGCSTDSSVRVIKNIEMQHQLSLFNRQTLAFIKSDQVHTIPLSRLQLSFTQNEIDEETMYFNNTVLTLSELETNWLIPVKRSWLMGKISG